MLQIEGYIRTLKIPDIFYPKGSCCLMNMNIRHLEEFDEYCRVIFLEFTQEYILNLLQFPSVFSGKRTKEYEMVRKFFFT